MSPRRPVNPKLTLPVRKINSELLTKCAKCGACTEVCPVYRATGREYFTARGKLHLISRLEAPFSPVFGDILTKCLLCGACVEACPRHIKITEIIIAARAELPPEADRHFLSKASVTTILSSPTLLRGLRKMGGLTGAILSRLLKDSGLRDKLAILDPELIKQAGARNNNLISCLPIVAKEKKLKPVYYFSGCLARYLYPDIASATACLSARLKTQSLHTPENQTCCGLAAQARGDLAEARKLAKKNIKAFSADQLPVLTSCASCFHQLQSYPDLFRNDGKWLARARAFAARVREFSTYFNDAFDVADHYQSKNDKGQQTIFYHDPCHLRYGPHKVILPPRELLTKATGQVPVELPDGPRCCGHGGLFSLTNPDLADKIFQQLLEGLQKTSAETVLTTCSGCLLQWQQKTGETNTSYRVEHLAVFLVRQLLFPFPAPEAEF